MGWLRLACVGLLALTDETYMAQVVSRGGDGRGGRREGSRRRAGVFWCSGDDIVMRMRRGLSVTTIVCMEVLYVCMYGQYCTGEVER
jgi:hypothetical protein